MPSLLRVSSLRVSSLRVAPLLALTLLGSAPVCEARPTPLLSAAGPLRPAPSPAEPLIADAPLWGAKDAARSQPFLRVTLHGQPATLLLRLDSDVPLQLATVALTQLGTPIARETRELDSLTIGTTVERQLPVTFNEDPSWAVLPPPGYPPVVGVLGGAFLRRYDVLYDLPGARVRLYRPVKPAAPGQGKAPAPWLPPGMKPSDCGRLVPLPPRTGAYTAFALQLEGHPVTGVVELAPTYEKLNQAAVQALGFPDSSARIEPIPAGLLSPGYRHNGFLITQQVRDVHLRLGPTPFWSGPVQIFPSLDIESVLGAKTPVILLNLNTLRHVVLFNAPSRAQVCVSSP
ncbi:MAG TPA: hypothetical protein VFU47_03425 [Armatimonadota bacterium]|nr:hypothetical protein [Armatimonadota bacterium]